MRRKRRMLVWATAGASLAVLVVVAVVVHTVGAWLITAVLAGAASVVASGVAKLADRGAAQGRELVGGRSDPLTVTAKFEVGPLLKIREDLRPDGWEYMAASQQNVRLLIEAVEDQAVILGGLRILVESRQPPLDGELMIPHAALPLRTFDVDLDEESPRPVPRANTPPFPYAVSPHDPEQFLIIARTSRSFVKWRLAIDWTCKGKAGSTIVDAQGSAFRVTA